MHGEGNSQTENVVGKPVPLFRRIEVDEDAWYKRPATWSRFRSVFDPLAHARSAVRPPVHVAEARRELALFCEMLIYSSRFSFDRMRLSLDNFW